jgi:glycolate oxidase FAD binding subunit
MWGVGPGSRGSEMITGLERWEDPLAHGVVERFRVGVAGDSVAAGDSVWRYSCAGVAPHCVVTPRSVEEVCDAVRLAAASHFAVVPCGHGTHLYIGSPPRKYDAALSVRRLDRIVAYDASDLTVTVEAGATLQGLNARLAQTDQWLPLDPSYGDSITVGGLVAADRNGPIRLAYGKARDLLLGVKVVTADGEVLRGGGRVVKNVAGYDLPKLFVGSFGTLGVIVEASFRVWPRPAQQRVFVWPAPSVADAVERGLMLLRSGVTPILLEALNANAGEAVGVGSAALVVGCAGCEAEVQAEEKKLGELLPDLEVVEDREAEALHKALAAFPQPMSEDALVARVSVLSSDLARLLRRFEGEAEGRGVTLEVAAHVGNGVAWCQMAGPFAPLDFALCAEAMRIQTRAADGWLVFEALPPGLQGRFDAWGFNETALPLMRRVKSALDPGGLFSPGRFVGGI